MRESWFKQPAFMDTEKERDRVIEALDAAAAPLSIIMLVLLVVELVTTLPAAVDRKIILAHNVLWVVLVGQFLFCFALAADKKRYLRTHWLELMSVGIPHLRALRILGALRFLTTFRLTGLLLLSGRSIGELMATITTSRILYLSLVALLVNAVGAAGIFILEHQHPESQILSFGDGIWWAVGNAVQLSLNAVPVTPEGRVWGTIIQVVNVGIASYLTAVIASYLVERDKTPFDAEDPQDPTRQEIAQLRERVDYLVRLLEERGQEGETESRGTERRREEGMGERESGGVGEGER